jgi:YfiH family protein
MHKDNIYRFSSLHHLPGIIHGVSTRSFGSIKNRGRVNEENLDAFVSSLDIPADRVVGMQQTHSNLVSIIDNTNNKIILYADGLVTNRKNVFLYAVTADCLPIVFFEPQHEIMGVAHVGYKGLVKGIVSEMIKNILALGGEVSAIKVGIGPAIGVCCYEFGEDMLGLFSKYTRYFEKRDGKYYVNLKMIVMQELESCGIKRTQVEILDICTKDNLEIFYSARGEEKETYGEFATIIGMI